MSLCLIFYTDDETRNSSLYIDELEKDFEVRYIRAVESVDWYRQAIISDGPKIIVQDVMLPHPASDGNDGIDVSAGLKLIEELSDTLTTLKIGVIVFSNRVRNDLDEAMEEMGFPPELFEVHNKMTVGFPDLAKIAREMHFRLK